MLFREDSLKLSRLDKEKDVYIQRIIKTTNSNQHKLFFPKNELEITAFTPLIDLVEK